MAFDNIPTRTMTAAAALALYDRACADRDTINKAAAADVLAAILRAKSAPKAKATGPLVEMRAGLKLLLKAYDRRATTPILANVELVATGDKLTMTTTNLDQEMSVTVDFPGVGAWSNTVPVKTLSDMIAKGSGPLDLDDEGSHVLLHLDGMLTRLDALPVKDFPHMEPELGDAATIPGDALADALAFVRPAVSMEETRYYLNGVFMHTPLHGPTKPIVLVATDGHRLQKVEIERPAGFPDLPADGLIIPRATVDSLMAMLAADAGEVAMSYSREAVRFEVGGATLVSKVVEGAFPDYQRVIPRLFDRSTLLEADALAASASRLMKLSSSKSKSIRLQVRPTVIVCTARDIGGGEATSEVAARQVEGDISEIAFNGRYVLDVCEAFKGQTVAFECRSASDPAVVRNPDMPDRLSVLMPLRF